MNRRDYPLVINGLTLHVTEWGDIGGEPVVMLHGIRGYAETFAGVVAGLQPGVRVIAWDQRGRGRSDWDPECNYYTDAYMQDLDSVVDTLGVERFDLLGHSMGGIIALAYAAKNRTRVRRLVIEDAGPGAFESSPGASRIRKELMSTPVQFESWEAASDFMRMLRPTVTEEARQQRLKSMLKPMEKGSGFTWRYDHAGIARTRLQPDPDRVVDLVPCVKAIACPTLVIRGTRTDYLQADMARRMCELNPLLSTTEIPDAGHYVHDDQPELFLQAVRSFLKPSRV